MQPDINKNKPDINKNKVNKSKTERKKSPLAEMEKNIYQILVVKSV